MAFYCKCKWNVEIKLSFNCVNSSSEFSLEWGKGGKKNAPLVNGQRHDVNNDSLED